MIIRTFNNLSNSAKSMLIITRKLHVERKSSKIQQAVNDISTVAMKRYYELIRFEEIDNQYKKVSLLQVNIIFVFRLCIKLVFKNFKEELAKYQGERATIQLQINNALAELSNLQTELQDYKRGESKYIDLMKKGSDSKLFLTKK
jgi:hypothetical protein